MGNSSWMGLMDVRALRTRMCTCAGLGGTWTLSSAVGTQPAARPGPSPAHLATA
jgi:hypothetical protein